MLRLRPMTRVRPMRARDLDAVCRTSHQRARVRHLERYQQQRDGRLVYLIGWHDGEPAGHLMVVWPSDREQSEFMERYACAEVVDLWVAPERRRRGVGRALMLEAERAAAARGARRLGLSTGADGGYSAARVLYADLGYRDTGCGRFIETWAWLNDEGARRPGGEILLSYFVKDL